jgi:hypothetical protein
MSAVTDQPNNINFLSQNSFRFSIKRLPNVNYFCQGVSLPGVSIGAIETPTPLAFIPRPGDRITYEPLVVKFRVDGNLQNYLEIQKWIEGMGHPDDLNQTTSLSRQIRNEQVGLRPLGTMVNFVSDGVLTILTSNKNINKVIFFRDCFPINLTELTFDSTNTTVEYLEASVTFRYRKYEVEN